ncbi:hypothetical protein SADUNF_Sadunf09G0056500 [Salix dunnii]|uniref:Uncharacterized protein n=1 Tax=Salix dunnii TaxID=1413687 RepID=A0A835JUA3_9ROSI|nr:hypothetical protein SADUNF_Sadunf09G0056500 [Salix dunnii]
MGFASGFMVGVIIGHIAFKKRRELFLKVFRTRQQRGQKLLNKLKFEKREEKLEDESNYPPRGKEGESPWPGYVRKALPEISFRMENKQSQGQRNK